MNTNTDEFYMGRCLELARKGRLLSRPNPMVGAVIVAETTSTTHPQPLPKGGESVATPPQQPSFCPRDTRIIGEGYHARCGEGHAEVNAFASVRADDEPLLPHSTIYVSLEPCSHYGKTPPCAELIIRKGVRRVVVGCQDPFAKVQGRGIEMLRNAGIEVTVGVLEDECRWINRRFFTFHKLHRPYIILKWACSADGYLDDHHRAAAFSTPYTSMLVHKMRAEEDAILVGRITDEREHPRLDTRLWSGPAPHRFVLSHEMPIESILAECREHNLQSLIVEGGAATHRSFIERGLYDEIRTETSPLVTGGGTPAPKLPAGLQLISSVQTDGNIINRYTNVSV